MKFGLREEAHSGSTCDSLLIINLRILRLLHPAIDIDSEVHRGSRRHHFHFEIKLLQNFAHGIYIGLKLEKWDVRSVPDVTQFRHAGRHASRRKLFLALKQGKLQLLAVISSENFAPCISNWVFL
jgi:hypothetical protein